MGTGASRAEDFSTGFILLSFLVLFAFGLLALARIDAEYEKVQGDLEQAIRKILLPRSTHDAPLPELDALIGALDRIDRFALKESLEEQRRELAAIRAAWPMDEARLKGFIASFERLERAIEAKRRSIVNSFYSLIGALALSLIAVVVVSLSLRYRLRMSRVEANWSREAHARSLAAEEEVRRRISRELHDDAAQELAAAKMLCERALDADDARKDGWIEEAIALIGKASRNLRSLALDLRPPELDRGGLVSALDALCERHRKHTGTELRFTAAASAPELPSASAIQAYRVFQEALANASKHAPSHRVIAVLTPASVDGQSGLELSLRDEADSDRARPEPMIDPSTSSGMGLAIMRERAALAGGRLTIESDARGYSVRLFIPCALTQ